MSPTHASRLPPFTVQRPEPLPYDHCLRYWVWSRTVPGKKYLVQLDSYGANGECQCKNFECEKGPLLKRGITPAVAFEQELVRMKENQRPEDALRCIHIVDAMMQFAEDAARAISNAEKKQAPRAEY